MDRRESGRYEITGKTKLKNREGLSQVLEVETFKRAIVRDSVKSTNEVAHENEPRLAVPSCHGMIYKHPNSK